MRLFSIPMGLLGLGLAWARQEGAGSGAVSAGLVVLGAAALAATLAAYAAMAIRRPARAADDWHDAARVNFFAGVPISLMLLPAGLGGALGAAAGPLWLAGAALHLALALALTVRWLAGGQDIAGLTPAWFLPVVGMIVAPFAGPGLGYGAFAGFLFTTGLALWAALLPAVLARLIFTGPLPPAARPALFILIAPPALAAIGLDALSPDTWAIAPLFGVALFFAIAVVLVMMRDRRALYGAGFSLAWWSTTFPLAALASAAAVAGPAHAGLAAVLLAAASGAVALAALMTLRLATARQ